MARFLYMDNHRSLRAAALEVAKGIGFDLVIPTTVQEAQVALSTDAFDAVISDYGRLRGRLRYQESQGLQLLRHIHAQEEKTPFFFLSNRPAGEILGAVYRSGLELPKDHIVSKRRYFIDFLLDLEAGPQIPARTVRKIIQDFTQTPS